MERLASPFICLLLLLFFSLLLEAASLAAAAIPTAALEHSDGSSSDDEPQNLMNGLSSELQSPDKSLDTLIFPPESPFPFIFPPPAFPPPSPRFPFIFPPPPSPPPPSPPPPPPSPPPPPPPPFSPPPRPVSVATLSNIAISNGATLDPAFNESIFSYHASVSYKVSLVTVTANVTKEEENTEYELKVNGIGVISGIPSPPFALGKQGEATEFIIYVYSVNHIPSKYTISLTRGKKKGGLPLGYLILIIVAVVVVALVLLCLGYGFYQRRRAGRLPAWLNFSRSEQPDSYTPIRPANSP